MPIPITSNINKVGMSNLGRQVAAVNCLLTFVYKQEIRLSSIFLQLGADDDEIKVIRDHYVIQACARIMDAVSECFQGFCNGDRDYKILVCRLGLGCEARTLQDIADEYGISRERVRQLEMRARRKCRHKKNRAAIEATLRELLDMARISIE